MVLEPLEHRMLTPRRKLLIGLLVLLLAGCGRPDSKSEPAKSLKKVDSTSAVVIADTTIVEGTQLDLLSEDNTCVLRSGNTVVALQPKAPCFFLRRSGKVQTHAYKDAAVDWIVIVAGTSINDTKRKLWNLGDREICGEQSQAVFQKAGRLQIVRTIHSGGIYCKDKGVDEKEFWAFAHDPDESPK